MLKIFVILQLVLIQHFKMALNLLEKHTPRTNKKQASKQASKQATTTTRQTTTRTFFFILGKYQQAQSIK